MGNSASYFKEILDRNEGPPLKNGSPICISIQSLTDPRSPSTQFSRTPIEVENRSKRLKSWGHVPSPLAKSRSPTDSDSYLDDTSKESSKEEKEEEEEKEEMLIKLHKLHLSPLDPRSPSAGIFRTPIQLGATDSDDAQKSNGEESSPSDSFVTTVSLEECMFEPNESSGTPDMKQEVCLPDPRSPSEGVTRTPIQVECTSDTNKHLFSKLETNDKYATPKTKGRQLRSKSDGTSRTLKLDESYESSVENYDSAKWNKENLESLAKKLFNSPDSKHITQIPKLRTPLGTVFTSNSPHQILRAKQSREINQELGRALGLKNTLPENQKYTSEWDQDSTVVI